MNAGIPLPTPEPKAGNISTANGPSNTELFNKIRQFQPLPPPGTTMCYYANSDRPKLDAWYDLAASSRGTTRT